MTCLWSAVQIAWLPRAFPGVGLWASLLAGGYFRTARKCLVLFPGLLVGSLRPVEQLCSLPDLIL